MGESFYTGVRALQERARYLPPDAQSRLLREMFPQVREQQFDGKWARLGFRRLPGDPGFNANANRFQVSIKEATRMLVMGSTGSGKSMLLRRLGDFYHHAGFAVVYLSDIKDEMKSSAKPAPDKFAKLLDADDIAQPMRMRVYRPVFFSKVFSERLPAGNQPFAVPYAAATFPDLLIALGFNNEKFKNQQNELSVLYKKATSLQDLFELVDEQVKNAGIRDSIKRSLKSLIAINAFSPQPVGDVVGDLRDGFAVVINMRGYDRISVGPATLPQIYLSILQRLIVDARDNFKGGRGPKEKKLPRKVVFIIDEAPKFLEKGTLSYAKLLEAVDLYRYLGVSMIFAAQTRDRVPEALIDQCRYLFIPYNITPATAWKILQNSHVYNWHAYAKKALIDTLKTMRILPDGRRNWACVDTHKKASDIFYAYPALSAHTEE